MSRLSTRLTHNLLTALEIMESYTLQEIADLLEMQFTGALRKGVLSRTGENAIVLLINIEKHKEATPYRDHVDNDVLYWEGQLKNRFVEKNMNSGEYEIFVFIREKREQRDYRYYGRAIPIASQYFEPGTPCKTKFSLYEYADTVFYHGDYTGGPYADIDDPVRYDRIINTTRIATIEQRSVQQQYRRDALRLWDNRCAVLGVEEPKILIASHIKPWRVSNDQERVDPRNSLILSPLYDKLFDLGMITFSTSNGAIRLSSQLNSRDYDRLGVDDSKRLATIPDGTGEYLSYHQTYVFDFAPCAETELRSLIT
jgi:putative restriction endonuclease